MLHYVPRRYRPTGINKFDIRKVTVKTHPSYTAQQSDNALHPLMINDTSAVVAVLK